MSYRFSKTEIAKFKKYGLSHSVALEGYKFFLGVAQLDSIDKRDCIVYFGKSFHAGESKAVFVKQILEI